jgi:DNA-binding response OmpR family regulator
MFFDSSAHRNATALVVEGDPKVRSILRQHLGLAGYQVDAVGDGESALARARAAEFDVILLEVALPGLDGLSLCRAIRVSGRNRHTPILIVSGMNDEADTVLGLESGADDYVAKPFGTRELLARVEAVVRRQRWVGRRPHASGLALDHLRRLVTLDGRAIETTRQEFDLLHYLSSRPGVVLTRRALVENVWPGDAGVTARTVDALVCRLRRKIERDPHRPKRLVTSWGVGYTYVDPDARAAVPPGLPVRSLQPWSGGR